MWDWLRRSRMGMAEGRFIAININTCLQQRREQGDVWGRSRQVTLELSHQYQALPELPPRMQETPSTAPLRPVLEGLRWMPPCGGLGQSRTLRVRILYIPIQGSSVKRSARF